MTKTSVTAVTKRLEVSGSAFSYREIGEGLAVPVVLLNHLTGVLDDWDPIVIDGLAKRGRVIIFDNIGVGASGGKTPASIAQMANDAISFLSGLRLTTVDLIGFSMGGFIAQMIAQSRPDLVRRVVLAGTGPPGGEGISEVANVLRDAIGKSAASHRHPKQILFFSQTRHGQRAAEAFLQRLDARTEDRDTPVSDETIEAHLAAITEWGNDSKLARPLSAIKQPVLIVNGDNDVMVPTINSIALFRGVPKALLSIFPDAGHGAIFQYHREFVDQASQFFEN